LQKAVKRSNVLLKIAFFLRLAGSCGVAGGISTFSKSEPATAICRTSHALLKIALFCGLLEVVGGISAPSLEIRRSPGTFGFPWEVLKVRGNFWISAGSFESSRELLDFRGKF
jgi:hypothetical protein